MSITYGATGLGRTATRARHVSSFLKRSWLAYRQWRSRERLRADLCNLSDRELTDIGTTRSEIDYVASNQWRDPLGIRSVE